MKSKRRFIWLALAVAALAGAGCTGGGGSDTTEPDPTLFLNPGSNNKKILVAFGDSISDGEGSSDDEGYRGHLEDLLAADGRTGMEVVNEGEPGTVTEEGAERIDDVLEDDQPSVLLVLYGTNDEAQGIPMSIAAREATTSSYLREIITAGRRNKSVVVVSTIPPVCGTRSAQRERIQQMNAKIKSLVEGMNQTDPGVLLADAWTAFLEAAPPDGCSLIGPSDNHPNDAGYEVLAQSFYAPLTDVVW